nr:sulfurtransferase TusA family protein [uncultured Niameybacter sp.]
MKSLEIDVRGRSCPEPVFLTMEAIKKGEETFVVLADNKVAVENIKRCSNSKGFNVEVIEEGEEYRLKLKRK